MSYRIKNATAQGVSRVLNPHTETPELLACRDRGACLGQTPTSLPAAVAERDTTAGDPTVWQTAGVAGSLIVTELPSGEHACTV
jgi:hypothetical protein